LGQQAIAHLQERGGSDLGCAYQESLGDKLRGLESSRALAELPHTFHRVRVQDGDERAAANRLLRFYNGEAHDRGIIDSVELNALLVPATQYLGLPFKLGGKNADYLDQMNVPDAHQNSIKGQGIRIAIVDSGLDATSPLKIAGFYDIEIGNPIHSGVLKKTDNDGHGTAMAVLAAEVAPEAEIYIVRVMDQGALTLWNVLAGAGVAAFDCKAAVINLSLGFDSFAACGVCGATGSTRSAAFEKLLDGITKSTIHGGLRSPIYVASVGNEQASSSINCPAAYDSAVPVGSVNSSGDRSSFSNYRQGHTYARYFMAPGGDKNHANVVTEDVGDGGGTKCCGTSVATAYSAGMLALLWSDSRYDQLSRDDFLDAVLRTHCVKGWGQTGYEYGAGMIQYVP
jgi:Subtilase family